MSLGASPGTAARRDIIALCTAWATEHDAYDGWRSPWDQDEIMVCPHAIKDLQIAAKPNAPNDLNTLHHGSYWTCPSAELLRVYNPRNVREVFFGDANTAVPQSHPGRVLGGAFACMDSRAFNLAYDNRMANYAAYQATLAGLMGQTVGVPGSPVFMAYPHAASPKPIGMFSFEYTITSRGGWNPYIYANERFPSQSVDAPKTFRKLSCVLTTV